MKRILIALVAGVLTGVFAASYAKLPAPTAQEKAAAAAKAEKDTIDKAKAARELAQAQDRAVDNYKKNNKGKKGSSSAGATARPEPEQSSAGAPAPSEPQGADHSKSKPDTDLTPQEAQTEMPKPGQANDHSTTARDPQNSSGR
jgi:hypothetical protein